LRQQKAVRCVGKKLSRIRTKPDTLDCPS
jgi:hypothetical protein